LSPLIRTVAEADVIVSMVDKTVTAKKCARMFSFPVAHIGQSCAIRRKPRANHRPSAYCCS
jgi:hypothetical protein